MVAELIGSVYTLQAEDLFTPLRDAREFATFLNACGRMDKTDVGIAVCLGDREIALAEGMKLAGEYRTKINKALQLVQSDQEKTISHGELVLVAGEEFLEERLTGSIRVASWPRLPTSVRSSYWSEPSLGFESQILDTVWRRVHASVNLGQLMREAAEEVGGVGGGHSMAGEAKIPNREGRRLYQGYPQKGLFSIEDKGKGDDGMSRLGDCQEADDGALAGQQNVSQRPEIHF